MDERFLRARELFDALRELPSDTARQAFLAEQTREDEDLRNEVWALYARHEALGDRTESAPEAGLRAAAVAAWEQATQHAAHDTSLSTLGRYSILGVLGRGGMATVFRARQDEPERDVALKVLHPGTFDAAGKARFRQEAGLLARLRHEGIAQVYEFDEAQTAEGTRTFIAMELVEGQNLVDYARAQGLGMHARVDLLLQILDAIGDAHRQGIIHRDLKPGNILVNARGRVKLLDFGVAREEDTDENLTRTGDVVGTLLYMSPEQVRGALVDTRADLYAVGLCAFELLSGSRARDAGGGPTRLLESILHGDLPPLARVAADVPVDLCHVVDKALSDEPDRRYATADAFADDLRRFQRSETVTARAPTLRYQMTRFVHRHRPLVIATGLTVFALVTGLVLALRAGAEARDERTKSDALAAERLRDISIVRIRSAVEHLAAGRPRLADGILQRVPASHRTWTWAYVKASLEESTDHVQTPGILQSLSDDRQRVRARVYDLDEQGQLHTTDEARERDASPMERARMDKEAQVPAPALVRCEDGTLLDLRPDRTLGGPRWPTGSMNVLEARPGTSAYEVWIMRSTLRLRPPGSSQESLPRLPVHRPRCFSLHPTQPLLLVGGSDHDLFLTDLRTREVIWHSSGHSAAVTAVAWSRDGRHMASVDSLGTLLIHDLASRRTVARQRSRAEEVEDLKWAPDGRTLVGLGRDGLRTWRPFSAAPAVLRYHGKAKPNYVYAVDVSPDGRRVASGAWDKTIRIVSSVTGDLIATFETGTDPITDVAYALDGRRLVVSCTDALYVFDSDTGEQLARWDDGRRYRRLAVSQDGTRVIWRSGSEGRIDMLDLTRPLAMTSLLDAVPEPLQRSEQGPWKYEAGFAFGPNEQSVIQRTYARVWLARGIEDARVLAEVPHDDEEVGVADLRLHGDGRRIIAAGPGPDIGVYDVRSGALELSLPGHTDQVFGLAVHPEGRMLASASNDRTVRVWDLEGGGESVVLPGHTSYVHDVVFSPDGRTLYSASGDSTVRVWSTIPQTERQAALVKERNLRQRVAPKVAALLAEHASAASALQAIDGAAFAGDEAERLAARDELLQQLRGR